MAGLRQFDTDRGLKFLPFMAGLRQFDTGTGARDRGGLDTVFQRETRNATPQNISQFTSIHINHSPTSSLPFFSQHSVSISHAPSPPEPCPNPSYTVTTPSMPSASSDSSLSRAIRSAVTPRSMPLSIAAVLNRLMTCLPID